jgi:hypothetical protein
MPCLIMNCLWTSGWEHVQSQMLWSPYVIIIHLHFILYGGFLLPTHPMGTLIGKGIVLTLRFSTLLKLYQPQGHKLTLGYKADEHGLVKGPSEPDPHKCTMQDG